MSSSVPEAPPPPPGASFDCSSKFPFSNPSFGYYFSAPQLPSLPPPPPPPPLLPMLLPHLPPLLSADSYPLFWNRQKEAPKPFSNAIPQSLPFNKNQEYTQLPNTNRYCSCNGESNPNGFCASLKDFPCPSYTEIVPFADYVGIGYPPQPRTFVTYVEQFYLTNQQNIGEHPVFNKSIGSVVPGFGEDFASRPKFNKPYLPQPENSEQQLFETIPGFYPDLQFCRYSSFGDSDKFCEYSGENECNGFVSYSETINILSITPMSNLSKRKTRRAVEQNANGCLLISQSKISSNHNCTSLFRHFSIKPSARCKQLNDQ